MDEMEDWSLILLSIETAPEATLPRWPMNTRSPSLSARKGCPCPPCAHSSPAPGICTNPRGMRRGSRAAWPCWAIRRPLTQWWQETPPAPRGTHRIEVRLDQTADTGPAARQPRAVRAIWRMIHAMQRWSQDHAVRLVSEAQTAVRAGVGVNCAVRIQIEPFDEGIPEVAAQISVGAGLVVGR